MEVASPPVKFSVPWANAASATYKNVPIPVPSQIAITPGAASFTDGFPPLNFLPLAGGGVPPRGVDVNGILSMLTAAMQWSEAGGPWVWDSAFATAVGGYPKGAVIMKATLDGFWLCTADDNLNNPDASGAGWVDYASKLGPIASISTVTAVGGGNTSSATFISAGASMVVTKKKASNILLLIGVVNILNDVSSSTAGTLANARIAENTGSGFFGVGAAPQVGGQALTGQNKMGATAFLMAVDTAGPTAPTVRIEVESVGGAFLNYNGAMLVAIELWQ